MSDITMPEKGRKGLYFEPCPDDWARFHVFYNPATGQSLPARCKRWSCWSCAQVNYYKVDHLMSLGNPQRFITLTRAGNTPKEININLKKLVKGIRRLGKTFEYFSTPELHLNGQAHLHLMQRGDFIEQAKLSEMWETYTAKSYAGAGSFIVDIRYIHERQNVRGYLLKYLKKSWDNEQMDPKSWHALQDRYPGLNHYRMSRNWVQIAVEKPTGWQIVPKAYLDTIERSNEPVLDDWFEDLYPALSPVQALALSGRSKPSRVAKQLAKPLTALVIEDNQIKVG